MSNSSNQMSTGDIIEALTELTASGVLTGFARDTWPESNDIQWILSGPGQSRVLYLNSIEARAYIQGAQQALSAIRSARAGTKRLAST